MSPARRTARSSIFSEIIMFIVVFSIFISTTVKACPDDSSVITQVLKNLYNVLFDTSGNSYINSVDGNNYQITGSSVEGGITTVTGRDPWDVPPVPPPPPTQE